MNQRNLTLHSTLPKGADDSDSFIDIDRLIAILIRRAGSIALCVAATVTLAVIYLLFATAQYTSMTQILLDDNMAKYAQDATPVASSQQVDMEIASAVEILKSNQLALRVVDAEKLQDNDTLLDPPKSPAALIKSGIKLVVSALAPGGPPATEADERNARRQKAAALLQDAVTVSRVNRSSVLAVSFRSTDKLLAARITKAYANAYLNDQLNANFDATESASVWLQQRLSDLRERSQQAALDVAKFKAENGLTSANGELMSEQQLADLNKQLIVAQADSASASARYNQFKSIIDLGPESAVNNAAISSGQADNTVIKDLRTRYAAVNKREQEVTTNFGEDHPQAVALRAEKQDLTRQIYQELQQLTASYRNEFEVTRSREASLRQNIEHLTGKNSEADRSIVQLSDLEQRAAALKTLYESYLGKYEEASQQQSFPIAKARVISEAGVPVSPSSPKKTMTLGLAIVLGLMAGGALTAFQEFRERFFRVEGDVRTMLGLKFLGYLPRIGKPTRDGTIFRQRTSPSVEPAEAADSDATFERIMRVVLEAPRSIFAETLRNAKLASDVMFQGKSDRVIGVVSAMPGEGKSTTAANFAALLASSGKRTLLIDADLRNPGLTRMLKNPPQQGLVEAVLGEVPWASAVKIDPRTKLAILPVLPNDHLMHTSELLASQGMFNLMENARKMFDYIVVDLAPLGPVIDAKAFAPQVDGFLFVTEWGSTPTSVVRDLLNAEPQIKSKILGVILNKTDMTELGKFTNFGGTERYRHKYVSYYTDEKSKKREPAEAGA
ncbi:MULTISPECIES: polysaccharide biosynthesis tyrosine autokinase [unclassified Rhizobium]|uniref:polysaccharide biosynthesis tyrosine autokinase n=1 Tax=unclassified Rhizobium TaxID=2613769 RepID=UPI0016177558|nr:MULTISPECIES: polysaccharide biosynthesis tyrosine autokinase [unclassified Rhizobium]MBB3541232.1 succinoglycan biosynthesis transport protein ExoP [Rhizobium sp. BK399]MCS3739957.1 succinoglycan biosynthesis transport protein ExoP [Rhizobium sp. BK661]MCS4092093.1 succinoglycan biosynthesis transport protein ExoP [Rhizobium sp. BK176]